MPGNVKYTKFSFLTKLMYINFNKHINIRDEEKGISTSKLRRADTFILAMHVFYYLTVKVLYNVVKNNW